MNLIGGSRDAFRHTYWNMLIAGEFGAKFAFNLMFAHERNAIALDWQEAMDLYNNEQGRLAAKAFENDPSFFKSAPHYVQYLVRTVRCSLSGRTTTREAKRGELPARAQQPGAQRLPLRHAGRTEDAIRCRSRSAAVRHDGRWSMCGSLAC